MAEQYKLIHPVKFYRDYLNKDIRPDGREFDKLRPIAINVGSIITADGSAVVKVGNTSVVCGIRAELAKPRSSTPENGFLIPNVELPQMCSPKYRSGAGSNDDSDVFSSAINDILINSNCLNLKELCLHKEKLVWALHCDIICLDNDGCVVDTALIACVAALRNLKLPAIEYDHKINKVHVDTSEKKKLNIGPLPVSTTFMVFDDNVIITDPTAEEESLSTSVVNIAICKGDVCFILKPGGTPFGKDQMDTCIKQALRREKDVLKLLNEVCKDTNGTK
ncbi:exosome complex component RRP43-like [Eupeodes corollae]|uniref:exosome complex component RRP43-like n=1 Tax=Eupeodes corollae TaxID=290404 RepID=UPI002490075A|nr:exosome complex component RRP43-like [Eupeodes corollae]